MKKIFGFIKMSSLDVLAAEYIGLGVLVSLFSIFLGFYAAAFILADQCYPELGLATIEIIHRQIFHNLALWAAGYSLVIFILYWVFAGAQVKSIVKIARETAGPGTK